MLTLQNLDIQEVRTESSVIVEGDQEGQVQGGQVPVLEESPCPWWCCWVLSGMRSVQQLIHACNMHHQQKFCN